MRSVFLPKKPKNPVITQSASTNFAGLSPSQSDSVSDSDSGKKSDTALSFTQVTTSQSDPPEICGVNVKKWP